MHALHARLPKHFVLEERLERYADAIEPDPCAWRGIWAEACYPLGRQAPDPGAAGACEKDPGVAGAPAMGREASSRTSQGAGRDGISPLSAHGRFREVRLDLGCGKGVFTVEAARREPDVLFLGMDYEPICIAYAAQHAIESGLANVLFIPGNGDRVAEMFEPGELDGIYINFPTPHPRRKHARLRLTYLDRLVTYADLLAPGATVTFKTDSQPLYLFSLAQFDLAGYDLLWRSEDVEALRPGDPRTGYEERLTAQGAKVCGLCARPRADRPRHPVQTAELSLPRYLPDDLEHLGYVPHGMEGTVTNLRNWRAKHDPDDASKESATGAPDSRGVEPPLA